MGELDGRVALITGAARGQGAAHAALFARHGARVVLADVLDAEGEETTRQVKDAGGDAVYMHLDVSAAEDWSRAVISVQEWAGPVDVLVNNAGVLSLATVVDTDDAEWERVIGVNQYGVFQGMKHVLPGMIEKGRGSIVNVASVYGVVGTAGYAAYLASKGAILAMSRGAAMSYGAHNIRVNTVCPGLVFTKMAEEEGGEDVIRGFLKEIPLGRGADPVEVSEAVLFLASDRSSYITGTELVIDGGLIAG